MIRDPVFEMEFSAVGGAELDAVASGGALPGGSHGGEAVERWW